MTSAKVGGPGAYGGRGTRKQRTTPMAQETDDNNATSDDNNDAEAKTDPIISDGRIANRAIQRDRKRYDY